MDRVGQTDRTDHIGRALPCLMSVWPGLPQLWQSGKWTGMVKALAFAFLLQVTVVTTLIWPESIGWGARAVVWFCVIGFWLLFAAPRFAQAWSDWRGGYSLANFEHLFIAAQREYLKGNWHKAERKLAKLLELDSGDVDARLMLASLFRHAGRREAAKQHLDRLVQSPNSAKWNFEVFQERLLLARAARQVRDCESELDGDEMNSDGGNVETESVQSPEGTQAA